MSLPTMQTPLGLRDASLMNESRHSSHSTGGSASNRAKGRGAMQKRNSHLLPHSEVSRSSQSAIPTRNASPGSADAKNLPRNYNLTLLPSTVRPADAEKAPKVKPPAPSQHTSPRPYPTDVSIGSDRQQDGLSAAADSNPGQRREMPGPLGNLPSLPRATATAPVPLPLPGGANGTPSSASARNPPKGPVVGVLTTVQDGVRGYSLRRPQAGGNDGSTSPLMQVTRRATHGGGETYDRVAASPHNAQRLSNPNIGRGFTNAPSNTSPSLVAAHSRRMKRLSRRGSGFTGGFSMGNIGYPSDLPSDLPAGTAPGSGHSSTTSAGFSQYRGSTRTLGSRSTSVNFYEPPGTNSSLYNTGESPTPSHHAAEFVNDSAYYYEPSHSYGDLFDGLESSRRPHGPNGASTARGAAGVSAYNTVRDTMFNQHDGFDSFFQPPESFHGRREELLLDPQAPVSDSDDEHDEKRATLTMSASYRNGGSAREKELMGYSTFPWMSAANPELEATYRNPRATPTLTAERLSSGHFAPPSAGKGEEGGEDKDSDDSSLSARSKLILQDQSRRRRLSAVNRRAGGGGETSTRDLLDVVETDKMSGTFHMGAGPSSSTVNQIFQERKRQLAAEAAEKEAMRGALDRFENATRSEGDDDSDASSTASEEGQAVAEEEEVEVNDGRRNGYAPSTIGGIHKAFVTMPRHLRSSSTASSTGSDEARGFSPRMERPLGFVDIFAGRPRVNRGPQPQWGGRTPQVRNPFRPDMPMLRTPARQKVHITLGFDPVREIVWVNASPDVMEVGSPTGHFPPPAMTMMMNAHGFPRWQ